MGTKFCCYCPGTYPESEFAVDQRGIIFHRRPGQPTWHPADPSSTRYKSPLGRLSLFQPHDDTGETDQPGEGEA